MFHVYVLKSESNGKRYIGYTSKPVCIRVKEHNNKANAWTKNNGPFRIIHEESFENKSEAMRREHFLKSGQGRKWLDENDH